MKWLYFTRNLHAQYLVSLNWLNSEFRRWYESVPILRIITSERLSSLRIAESLSLSCRIKIIGFIKSFGILEFLHSSRVRMEVVNRVRSTTKVKRVSGGLSNILRVWRLVGNTRLECRRHKMWCNIKIDDNDEDKIYMKFIQVNWNKLRIVCVQTP